jgi:hypothetical protein
VKYGYCLPPDEHAALLSDPPSTAEEFVDAVLRAEGFDPSLADKRAKRQLTEVVRDWLFDGGRGKGTGSGLPH